ncbi:unnamed protein product [Ectocarpus sp. CCAP 1310/34]|nr:unnamed protein product [Ectocarpus sp. CCAP 1310/34]
MSRSIFTYSLFFSHLAMATAFLASSPKVAPLFTTQPLSSYSPLRSLEQRAPRRQQSLQLSHEATKRATGRAATVAHVAPGHHSRQAQGRDAPEHERPVVASAGLSTFEMETSPTGLPSRKKPLFTPRFAALTASALAVGLAVSVLAPGTASAAVKAIVAGSEDEAHLHVGQKVAKFFRRGGLPDWATLMTISAMPVVELRGGVPVGIWMGMPIAKVFGLCVAGNMIPIPIILLALRSSFVQKLAKPVLDRAREKAAGFGDEKSQALALTLFVGIPLPGTGAWTGAMGAFLLGMPFQKASKAMLSIFLGVVSAGVIMSCLTLAGKAGALVATAVLAVFCVTNMLGGGEDGGNKASDFASK